MGVRMPKTAALDEMEDRFIECRDLGHNLQWTNDEKVIWKRNRPIQMIRLVVCPRCTYARRDTYDLPSMELVKSVPDYPDGYLSNHGRVKKQQARQEMFRRFMAQPRQRKKTA